MASFRRVTLPVATTLALAAAMSIGAAPAARSATLPQPTYQAGDYADGRAMSILPPGENGLVTAPQALAFETQGTRPPNSDDQLSKYAGLLYGAPSLTDSTLGNYYDDESFGIKPGDLQRTETPRSDVAIYRDGHDVPHIYGQTDEAAAYGAGYAQAEDRLFLMDVLRHYGAGTLSSFIGPSCADEQMDHDQLLLAPYTPAQAQAQIDALPQKYGAQGALAKSMLTAYVDGVNAYITATQTNPDLLPADYAAALLPPQPWVPGDIVDVAGLIGGIFGKGGGSEIANAALYQYLVKKLGAPAGAQAFANFKTQNDPLAPTTVVDKSFPYMTPGTVDPSTTALPDDATAPLTGGPTDTTPDCEGVPTSPTALAAIASLQTMPQHMSNALVVNASKSADGHPIAVFGPQVSYFNPEILSEEEIVSPNYHAMGASFPGTGLVELGRGVDFAWSATSAGSDLIDQRLEVICDPNGGTPTANEAYYLYNGQCLPMTHETFSETAIPKPGGTGAPTVINHEIYLTVHGIVQGWTTANGGKPVAVVTQRSTYNHDVDSVVGFRQWGQPALTHDVKTWMSGAEKILYTFNWFYVDNEHTAYYVSGLDPIRPSNVDPNLPTWGTGQSEWQGFLADDKHVHEMDPAQGFFVSWNNKPAPGFSAADDQYGYGQAYRSQMLVDQLKDQLAAHGGTVTRANVVQAMATAASQDLDGLTVLPQLLAYVNGRNEPAGVSAMLTELQSWLDNGAHRLKAQHSDTQYQHAAAIAIMDELVPDLAEAIYNPLLADGGIGGQGSTGGAVTPGYTILPMQFVNTPNSGDAHLGSAYDGGWEGYLETTLQQLRGLSPADAFGPAISGTWCGSGPASCPDAVDAALLKAYNDLSTANGSSTVSSWTDSTASHAEGVTMPTYDGIVFRAIGVVTQPEIDWQNRPTFQQVIEFYRHRSPAAASSPQVLGRVTTRATSLASTGGSGALALAALPMLMIGLSLVAIRRRSRAVAPVSERSA
jgi:acyl-homoserine lactone acylase PvdQ